MDKSVQSNTTVGTMTAMKTENQDNASSISTLVNGTILKTALTNPSEVRIRFTPVVSICAVGNSEGQLGALDEEISPIPFKYNSNVIRTRRISEI